MLGRPDLGANGTRNWPQSDMPPLLAALLGGPRRPLLGGAARRTQPLAGVPKLSAESAATRARARTRRFDGGDQQTNWARILWRGAMEGDRGG